MYIYILYIYTTHMLIIGVGSRPKQMSQTALNWPSLTAPKLSLFKPRHPTRLGFSAPHEPSHPDDCGGASTPAAPPPWRSSVMLVADCFFFERMWWLISLSPPQHSNFHIYQTITLSWDDLLFSICRDTNIIPLFHLLSTIMHPPCQQEREYAAWWDLQAYSVPL
jgi:hypothetical protein